MSSFKDEQPRPLNDLSIGLIIILFFFFFLRRKTDQVQNTPSLIIIDRQSQTQLNVTVIGQGIKARVQLK